MPTKADIDAALRTVLDPEMPVNIVDLGIVAAVRIDDGPGCVLVEVTPTFVGCPALGLLEELIRRSVSTVPGVSEVRVRFVNDPPWSTARISPAGREALRLHGVTTPVRPAGSGAGTDGIQTVSLNLAGRPLAEADVARDELLACPFCGSEQTALESRFGPTRCRMIYYCNACKNQFEHMKPV